MTLSEFNISHVLCFNIQIITLLKDTRGYPVQIVHVPIRPIEKRQRGNGMVFSITLGNKEKAACRPHVT